MSAPGSAVAAPEVRPMERADLGGVVDGWEALMQGGHAADPRFGAPPGARDAFRQRLAGSVFGAFHPFPPVWVAVSGGQVVGFVQGYPLQLPPAVHQPPTARIFDLWVRADHRRLGLGRQLVTAFTERARSAGHPWIEVGTLARDARAVAFWRSMGFEDWQVILLQSEPPGG